MNIPSIQSLSDRIKRLLGEQLRDLERNRGLAPLPPHRRGTAARRRRRRAKP